MKLCEISFDKTAIGLHGEGEKFICQIENIKLWEVEAYFQLQNIFKSSIAYRYNFFFQALLFKYQNTKF